MQHNPTPEGLIFPFPDPPAPGDTIEVAPGVLWFRLKLPFRLNHVNIYLIEDDGGWLVLDTGLATEDGRNGWDAVLNGSMRGQRLTRVLATHFHPDHIGLAGWLADRFGLKLSMPRTEYLFHLQARQESGDMLSAAHRGFYQMHGMSAEATEVVLGRGHGYLRLTTMAPPAYHRISHGDSLHVGGRAFEVLTGGGHALEQAMLHRASDRLLFSADQVIAKISPNVSVHPIEPESDVLGTYLQDLQALRGSAGPDVLVLPGHGLPFRGLHARIDELIAHHAQRCDLVGTSCRERPLSAAALIPRLFEQALDAHQTGFAFGEVLAHVNFMLGQGRLVQETATDGVLRYRAVGG